MTVVPLPIVTRPCNVLVPDAVSVLEEAMPAAESDPENVPPPATSSALAGVLKTPIFPEGSMTIAELKDADEPPLTHPVLVFMVTAPVDGFKSVRAHQPVCIAMLLLPL